MKLRWRHRLFLLAFPLLLGMGCEKKSAPEVAAPGVLARVGGEVITVDAFKDEAIRRAVPADNPAARQALLDEMVRNLRLLQLAREKGYERDPAVVRQYREILIGKARADFVADDDPELRAPSQEEIRAYYDAHRTEYALPARVRAAIIFVATPPGLNQESLDAKRRKMDEARAAVMAANLPDTSSFGGLAARFSESQDTRYIGGDLGYQVQGMISFTDDPAIAQALFALDKAGTLSEIVSGRDGLYLFKVLERNPAGFLPVEKVQGRVRSDLTALHRKDAEGKMESVLAAIPAEVHADVLTGLKFSESSNARLGSAAPPREPAQATAANADKRGN